MKIVDKKGILRSREDDLVLELGCGPRKRKPNAIGIDVLDYSCVDLVGDVYDVLRMLPDGCAKEVYSHSFIEHVDDLDMLMGELSRIVRIGGTLDFTAPHFSNPYYYSDPTHKKFFGLYTFCYLSESTLFSRKTPTYQAKMSFMLERVDLKFKAARPFYCRYAIKYILGKVFNSCSYLKELYEESLCYFFPCYEVRYQLKRINDF